jgi:hypothetical protein
LHDFGKNIPKNGICQPQRTYLFSQVAKYCKRRERKCAKWQTPYGRPGLTLGCQQKSAETQDWIAALSKSGLLHDLCAEAGRRDCADKITTMRQKNDPGAFAPRRCSRA